MIRRGPNIVFTLPTEGRPGGAFTSTAAIPIRSMSASQSHRSELLAALTANRRAHRLRSSRRELDTALAATAPIGIGKRVIRPSAVIAAAMSLSA
jgi:hypothetical protein